MKKKPYDPIKVDFIKMLVYGQPGVRKTSFGFTANKPYNIDFDEGMRRVSQKYRGEYESVSQWQDVMVIFEPGYVDEYDTLVFDTIGKALDMLARHLIKQNPKMGKFDGSLAIHGYSVLASTWNIFYNRLLDLRKNLVFLSHDKETRNGDEVKIRPDIMGQTMSKIIREMDLVGYIQVYNNNPAISFTPTDVFYGKNSCGLPPSIDINKITLANIIDKALENMNAESGEYKVYAQQLDQVKLYLKNSNTAEELNDAKPLILDIPFVSTAKKEASLLMHDRAIELGLVLNKETKLYEKAKSPISSNN